MGTGGDHSGLLSNAAIDEMAESVNDGESEGHLNDAFSARIRSSSASIVASAATSSHNAHSSASSSASEHLRRFGDRRSRFGGAGESESARACLRDCLGAPEAGEGVRSMAMLSVDGVDDRQGENVAKDVVGERSGGNGAREVLGEVDGA